MTRGRADGGQSKKLVPILLIVVVVGLIYLYSRSHGTSPVELGGRSLIKLGSSLGGEEEADSSTPAEDEENDFMLKSIPVCDDQHSELIPCLDRHFIYQMRLKLDLTLMEHYERHCPPPERRYNCLIPPPPGYKVPIKWPRSRDEVWKVNVPHTHLATEKSDQNWMVVRGDKIAFPGGGTHFHYGATKYIKLMANMLEFPDDIINNGGRIRTVFDVGCGVASFGAYLLKFDVITMSLAPNDVHQNQIQFALERGIPAFLGVLGTKRLPYPSRSFELAHCSRCRIDWLQRNGLLLMELDRVLRPGGYFAYSSPEAYAQDEEDLRIWREMSALVERMCWKIAAKKNQTVIWQKPLTNDCYLEREPGTQPPLCSSDDDPDAVWGVPMKPCIIPYSDHEHKASGSGLAPWPARLTTPPPRLADFGFSADLFERDTEMWRRRVEDYWNMLAPKIRPDTLRNLMDMKANMGSFAAALKDKPVWVMNVVPEDGPNTLKLVYDRGLLGVIHNWCESFSTYPRTYDLLHAWTIISDVERRGCSVEDLLIEMDRIVRPQGFIIIRDKRNIVDYIKKYLTALHWEAVGTADSGPASEEEDMTVLVIQKQLWLTSESVRDSE
uniref:Methyltransferase n=1 Tax=Opuntia streptacantha TaxID=393608 RepID=A0A7C8ZGH1_OPUST